MRALPDHSLLDRLVRGRAWIPVLGRAAGRDRRDAGRGPEARASIGRWVQRSTTLQSQNESLQASVASLTDDQRIERLAAGMGMVMPAPTTIAFLSASGGDTSRAIANIHTPDPTGFAYQLGRPGRGGSGGAAEPAQHRDHVEHGDHDRRGVRRTRDLDRGGGPDELADRAEHRHDDGHTSRRPVQHHWRGRRRAVAADRRRRAGAGYLPVERLDWGIAPDGHPRPADRGPVPSFVALLAVALMRAAYSDPSARGRCSRAAATQQVTTVTSSRRRAGTITDRNGVELAISRIGRRRRRRSVPDQADRQTQKDAQELAPLLGKPFATVLAGR